MDQAVDEFQSGKIRESVASFDRLAEVAPQAKPQLWQRGIALYYAGRFEDCRKQFELHRTVNPNDVENAAWHFLCVAREQSPAKAKSALLPVGADSRAPMAEIYRMFRGELTPDRIISAAGNSPEAQFYAHLYVGLFHEAQGDRAMAGKHIAIAAEDRFAMGGYMQMVAQVHRDILRGSIRVR
jgi:lipoprotein NlpI